MHGCCGVPEALSLTQFPCRYRLSPSLLSSLPALVARSISPYPSWPFVQDMARPLHMIDQDVAELQKTIIWTKQYLAKADADDVRYWLDLLTEEQRQMTTLLAERFMAVQQQAGEPTCALSMGGRQALDACGRQVGHVQGCLVQVQRGRASVRMRAQAWRAGPGCGRNRMLSEMQGAAQQPQDRVQAR